MVGACKMVILGISLLLTVSAVEGSTPKPFSLVDTINDMINVLKNITNQFSQQADTSTVKSTATTLSKDQVPTTAPNKNYTYPATTGKIAGTTRLPSTSNTATSIFAKLTGQNGSTSKPASTATGNLNGKVPTIVPVSAHLPNEFQQMPPLTTKGVSPQTSLSTTNSRTSTWPVTSSASTTRLPSTSNTATSISAKLTGHSGSTSKPASTATSPLNGKLPTIVAVTAHLPNEFYIIPPLPTIEILPQTSVSTTNSKMSTSTVTYSASTTSTTKPSSSVASTSRSTTKASATSQASGPTLKIGTSATKLQTFNVTSSGSELSSISILLLSGSCFFLAIW